MKDARFIGILVTAAGLAIMACAALQESAGDVIGCLIFGTVVTAFGGICLFITFRR